MPKNYAFAYAVKDRQSGDDFSHKQAHNGQSTKGEYRVKLPDGRTQIVSYTADNSGYKADVRYGRGCARLVLLRNCLCLRTILKLFYTSFKVEVVEQMKWL